MSPSPSFHKFDGRSIAACARRRWRRSPAAPGGTWPTALRRHQWLRALRAARDRGDRDPHLPAAQDPALAQQRARLPPTSSRSSASLDRPPTLDCLVKVRDAIDHRSLIFLSRRDEIRARRHQPGAGAPALAGLPDPGLPQDPDRRPSASARHGLQASHRPARRAAERLGRHHDRPARAVRRRHRYAGQPDRACPDLDLHVAPRELAEGRRALAGAGARGRGPAVRRAARAADPALRRPAHLRSDALLARPRRACGGGRRDRRDRGRRPSGRPDRGPHLDHRRCRAGRRPAAADGGGPADGVAPAASRRASSSLLPTTP